MYVFTFPFLFTGSKQRRAIIERIRKRGQFEWNINSKLNGGEYSATRRPNKKFRKNPWDLISCANCMGSYGLITLRRHWNNCTKNSLKGERVAHAFGRVVEGRLHNDASDYLVNIFAKLRDNACIRMVRFDWILILYGNDLCLNYSPHYQEGYICSKLRAAAKVLQASKSIDSGITDLSSLYYVTKCNTVVEAIRSMAKFDPQTKLFGSPSTALTTITLINTIGDLLVTEVGKLDQREKAADVDFFLKVFKKDVRTKVNKLVAITKAKNRLLRKLNIPTTADVNKLATFLDTERDKCFVQLTQKYSYEYWLKLSQLTLVTILVFNRRRAGEMRNINTSDFNVREIIAMQSDIVLDGIPEETRRKIKSRILIRGKLDRTVAALLKPSWDDCIELLIRHRKDAGIPKSNEFLFALPTQLRRIKVINVWTIMRSFAVACGAQNPSSLRGTNLRKHMASFCATRNLNDNDVSNLADFMGHDDAIHRNIYRNNPLSTQVSQMTLLLDAAQGNNISNFKTIPAKATQGKNPSTSDSDSSSDYGSDSCEDQSEKVTKMSGTRKTIRHRKRNNVRKLFISEPRVSKKKNAIPKGTSKKRKISTVPKMNKKRKLVK